MIKNEIVVLENSLRNSSTGLTPIAGYKPREKYIIIVMGIKNKRRHNLVRSSNVPIIQNLRTIAITSAKNNIKKSEITNIRAMKDLFDNIFLHMYNNKVGQLHNPLKPSLVVIQPVAISYETSRKKLF